MKVRHIADCGRFLLEFPHGSFHIVRKYRKPCTHIVDLCRLELWVAIYEAFCDAENDPAVRGVIFTSGLKRSVFTAGLDLKELHAPSTSKARLFEFWQTLSNALVAIYSSRLVTVAAIPGACPAGGCCLALCCDYRVISADGSMGLNEVAIGIPVPKFWIRLMKSVVGARHADYILQTGKHVKSEELLSMGMVHAVVPSKAEALEAGIAEMKKWLALPDAGRIQTKGELRGELAAAWKAGVDEEAGIVWDTISQPATAEFLGMVMASLSKKKKKKSRL